MDAFFTSVEQRDRPELRGKPVVVGGDPHSRGVVAGASYEARKYGIRSAMSSAKAHRLCPHAVFLPPDFSRYSKVSEQINEIFLSVTPLVEPLSIDEAYLDVTENLLQEPLARKLAIHIKERIRKELDLTASAGVGPNKLIAKIASDLRKPDGLVVVPPEKMKEFLAPLAVEKLWGVGPVTAERLHQLGIFKIGDLLKFSDAQLETSLGSYGPALRELAQGHDPRRVEPERESKSCGAETTFEKDILNPDELVRYIDDLAEEVSDDLRELGRPGKTITLKLKYSDFQSITRSRTLQRHTDDANIIARVATQLLFESTEAGRRPARLIGVSVSGLLREGEPEQLWLNFPPPYDF